MFDIDLFEGKDHNGDIPPYKYEKIGNTSGLLVRLCNHIYSTGHVVILDSGLYVLSGSSPRREKITSGYHNYPLKGLNLRYMYFSLSTFVN